MLWVFCQPSFPVKISPYQAASFPIVNPSCFTVVDSRHVTPQACIPSETSHAETLGPLGLLLPSSDREEDGDGERYCPSSLKSPCTFMVGSIIRVIPDPGSLSGI